jgi:hypothetical protein
VGSCCLLDEVAWLFYSISFTKLLNVIAFRFALDLFVMGVVTVMIRNFSWESYDCFLDYLRPDSGGGRVSRRKS